MIKFNFKALIVSFIFLFFILVQSKAQTGTISPYSYYGIGELQYSGFAHQRAMGGLGAALQSASRINFLNPASYVEDTLTNVEIGVDGTIVKLSDATNSTHKRNATISYLSFAFPVVKYRWSMSLGMTPYSAVGYDLKQTIPSNDTTFYYNGSGGFNRFYIGNGFRLWKNLYVGFNASYLFGSINRTWKVAFDQSGFKNTRNTKTITAKDFLFDYGLQYRFHLKNERELLVGLCGSNSSKINATKSQVWENYIVRGEDVTAAGDKVDTASTVSGNIIFPSTITVGVYLSKNRKWGLGMDVNYQDWSNYKSFGETDSLDKAVKIIVGGQWTPDYKSLKYFNRVEYRLGAFYTNGSIKTKGTSIIQTAITAGFGFPIRKSFQSMINISFEYGERGTVKDNLVKERYGKLLIGITFNEDWFHRHKYD